MFIVTGGPQLIHILNNGLNPKYHSIQKHYKFMKYEKNAGICGVSNGHIFINRFLIISILPSYWLHQHCATTVPRKSKINRSYIQFMAEAPCFCPRKVILPVEKHTSASQKWSIPQSSRLKIFWLEVTWSSVKISEV